MSTKINEEYENLKKTQNRNVIGPLLIQLQSNDEWYEIEKCGLYYYLRKGFYLQVTSSPAPRPNWDWFQIGEDNYIIFQGNNSEKNTNSKLNTVI